MIEATVGWPARFMEQLLPGHFGVASNKKEEEEMRAVAARHETSKQSEVQVEGHIRITWGRQEVLCITGINLYCDALCATGGGPSGTTYLRACAESIQGVEGGREQEWRKAQPHGVDQETGE